MDELARALGGFYLKLVLVSMRFAGLSATAPLFSGAPLPWTLRLLLSLLFGFALLPVVWGGPPDPPADVHSLALLGAKEVLLGVFLGLSSGFLFFVFQIGASIYGLQMGLGIMNVLDPYSQQQVVVTSQLKFLLALWFFLLFDGHLMTVFALKRSFDLIPPHSLRLPAEGLAEGVSLFGRLFELSLRLSLPVVGSLLLADLGLGFVSRTVPQLNVFALGFALKISLGLWVLLLTSSAVSSFFYSQLLRHFELFLSLLGG